MRINNTVWKIYFICLLLFVLIGCATIIHGGKQKIPIISSPSGAVVKVNQTVLTTPGVIILSRSEPAYVLRFEKEGYEPVEVRLVQGLDGWVWGNAILGGLIGLAIDFSTGAAYKLNPCEVNITLKSLGYTDYSGETYSKSTPIREKQQDKLVVMDAQELPTSTAEYYKLIYKKITGAVVMPKGVDLGVVNASLTILFNGELDEVNILEGSSDDGRLQNAVITAIKKSAPFPPLPQEIRNLGRKRFTVSFEFQE